MTSDDKHHLIIPIEPSNTAKSMRMDQVMSQIEINDLRKIVAEDLGENDDNIEICQPTKPSQPQNIAEEAIIISYVVEEAQS